MEMDEAVDEPLQVTRCRLCIQRVFAKWLQVLTKFDEDWSSGLSVMVFIVYRLLLELLRKQLTRAWRPL